MFETGNALHLIGVARALSLGLLTTALTTACATAESESEDEAELFAEAWDENQAPKSDSLACSGVVVPDRGPFGKRVALTFDDGPNPATTRVVLATLRAHHAPATFFINGRRVDSDDSRALAAEIATDPAFALANHSWSHPNMRTLSLADQSIQVDRTTTVINDAGGTPTFFRFPFGAATCESAAMVRDHGYRVAGWHVDTADWCFQAGGGTCRKETFQHVPDDMRGDMVAWTMQQVRARQGGVVLFHDVHRNTANTLDAVLDAMEAEGYTFIGLDDKTAFPILNGSQGTFVGGACTTDQSCTFDGGFCMGADKGEGRCTKACTSSCPDRAGSPTTRCVHGPDPGEAGGDVMPLCMIECGAGDSCPTNLECTTLLSPANVARKICW